MMKLMFYRGPGDLITRIIRTSTLGPYSHVELRFTNGCRFFTSGHGIFRGAHMLRDNRIYDSFWDAILIPVTQAQEDAAQRFAFTLIGIPFDMSGLVGFLLPGRSNYKGKYCSAVVMDVLQNGLHLFPGITTKVSPNGLHRLFLSQKHTLISDCRPPVKPPGESRIDSLQSALAVPCLAGSSQWLPIAEKAVDTDSTLSPPGAWFNEHVR